MTQVNNCYCIMKIRQHSFQIMHCMTVAIEIPHANMTLVWREDDDKVYYFMPALFSQRLKNTTACIRQILLTIIRRYPMGLLLI